MPKQLESQLPTPVQIVPTASGKAGLIDRVWSKLLNKLFGALSGGHLIVALPSGHRMSFGDRALSPILVSVHSNKLLWKLLSGDPLSLAEGNLQAQWSCNNQVGLFMLMQKNDALLRRIAASGWPRRALARFHHLRRSNSRAGSRRNIAYHYDLGNDFYGHWLDRSMTYSSAYQLSGESEAELFDAQRRKYTKVLDLLGLEAQSKLLEIGCGWGSMALSAAQSGHHMHSVTLSKEQLAYAQAQVADHQLDDRIALSLTDYRDLQGQYDGIISIEMIEAVGEAHWPIYFAKIRDCLKPGKRAVLQAIVMSDTLHDRYRKHVDFIQHYIFPGGFLPSPAKLEQQVSSAGLQLKESIYFGLDYAKTLHLWRRNFIDNWHHIEALGFDARFKRMWLYYLDYCEAGFRAGSINVGFFVIEKPVMT